MFDAICLGCSSSIKLLCNCAQKKESASTELGLTPEHDRLITCFSPLQTKARSAAEQVDATTLPYPWIGSEQGSTYSHEDQRFSHFLDHNHPSLDDEILAWLIGYVFSGVVIASTVGDLLPKDTFEKRWKRLAIWAFVIAGFASAYFE